MQADTKTLIKLGETSFLAGQAPGEFRAFFGGKSWTLAGKSNKEVLIIILEQTIHDLHHVALRRSKVLQSLQGLQASASGQDAATQGKRSKALAAWLETNRQIAVVMSHFKDQSIEMGKGMDLPPRKRKVASRSSLADVRHSKFSTLPSQS